MTAADDRAAALEMTDVSVVRGGRTVWSEGTFSVRAGAVVGVIGPNGAGKTTLFQLALGLLPAASGRVEVLGAAAAPGQPPDRLRAAELHRRPRATRSAAATWSPSGSPAAGSACAARRPPNAPGSTTPCGGSAPSSYADRRMSELSGGQQQRVAIAQAIVDDADLLLLDEPLANLDLRNQQEIVRLLGDLHRDRDVTIMVVAHDLNPLLPVLTEAIYLLDGHPHHDPITDVVQEELLTHLYGTPVGVVRTAQGDLFTRAAWRDPQR